MDDHPDRTGLPGRRAEALRNDGLILESARAVFVADPGAPISAVAKHAGVGISALYKRYPSKEDMLRTLCANGLARFIAETEAALADTRDSWTAFADFMRRAVDADTSSLTLALAGRFTPTEDMFAAGARANELLVELFERVRPLLRPEIGVHDVSLVFEQLAAVKAGSPERSAQLRHRYLALILAGMRARGEGDLPGPAPTWEEINARWTSG